MKKFILLSAVLPLMLSAAEIAWVFDKLPAKRAHVKGQTFFNAIAKPGIGKNGTGGLLCNAQTKNRVTNRLDYDAWQVSLDFKLDKIEKNVNRTIFAYEYQDWNRSRFLLEITKEGRLYATFRTIAKGERRKMSLFFEVSSAKLEWKPGVWYNLRFGSEKGGEFRIERDGMLVAGKAKAPALSDLNNGTKTPGYPLVCLGYNPRNPRVIGLPLFGVMDNIRIKDSFFKPQKASVSAPQAVPESSAKRIFIGKKPAWSGKFDVLDQTTEVLGAKKMADKRFLDNAARAAISIQGKYMIVDFDCPVPKDMKFVTSPKDSLWKECVEFFLCPVPGKESGYHYAVGANGKMYTAKMLAPAKKDDSFVSKATAKVTLRKNGYSVKLRVPLKEMELDKLREGDVVKGNFAREGKSCGGLSTWAPVGDSFYNPGRFGDFVFGSRKAFLDKQLDAFLKSAGDAASSKDIADRSKALRKEIATEGNKAAKTDLLLHKIDILRQEVIVQQLKQRKLLVWNPEVWRNDMEISLTSTPIKKISLSGPQGSHILYGFAVSNLSDKPFIGQIKLMSGPIKPYSNIRKWFYVDRGYTNLFYQTELYEGVPLESTSGVSLYDALAPLPNNTLLRIPPRTTAPLWMRISTKDVKAGVHKGCLVVKPACQGFELTQIPFEADILPVDLGKVYLKSFMYTYMNYHPERSDELTRFLVDHGVNMVYINGVIRYYKGIGKDGKMRPCDFTDLDDRVSRFLRCGVPPEELGIIFFLTWDQNMFVVPKKYSRAQNDAYRTEFLRKMVKHLTTKFKLKPENLIFYPVDEPQGSFSDPKSRNYKAAYYGKLIKKAVPECRTMVNPRKISEAEFNPALKRFSEIFDIVMLYRPRNGKKDMDVVRKAGKKVWYYHIMQKESAPESYRRFVWGNIRDKIDDVSTFWHYDSMAGGDGIDPYDSRGKNRTDYGTVYVDFNFCKVMPSRRSESFLQGQYDFKTVKLCRELLKKYPDPALEKKVEALVKRAVEGSNSTMDEVRQEILKIIVDLQKKHNVKK